MANANRRNNSIESLNVDGTPKSDPASISDQIVTFYESLFAEPLSWRPRLDNLEFDMLNVEEASSLEDPLEEREVREVLKGLDRDKAPNPNGFTLAFSRIVVRWLRETLWWSLKNFMIKVNL